MDNIQIRERNPSHNYRTEIPNIIHELDLDPYEFRVYAIIKRHAGDNGACTRSYSKMSEECKMSVRKFQKCIKNLCAVNPILGKPLIYVIERKTQLGDRDTNLLEIEDIWPENMDMFRIKRTYSDGGGGACGAPGVVHVVHQGGAPGAYKEEHIKEEHVCMCVSRAREEKIPIDVSKLKTSKLKPNGTVFQISLEEILTYSVMKRKDWTTPEVEEAWEILLEYQEPITNPNSFIEGIIKKNREKKEKENLCNKNSNNKKDKKPKNNSSKSESDRCKEFYMDPDTKESPFAIYARQNGLR